MKSDSYRRFIRCDQYKELLNAPANKQKRLVPVLTVRHRSDPFVSFKTCLGVIINVAFVSRKREYGPLEW